MPRASTRSTRAPRAIFRRPFAELARWQREAVLEWLPGVPGDFVALAFAHTLEGTYGAPEYGGNHERVELGLDALARRSSAAGLHARPDLGARPGMSAGHVVVIGSGAGGACCRVGARERGLRGHDPREGQEPLPRARGSSGPRPARVQRRRDQEPSRLSGHGQLCRAAYEPLAGRSGRRRRALVHGRRQPAARHGGRRHHALGWQGAALLQDGLRDALALRRRSKAPTSRTGPSATTSSRPGTTSSSASSGSRAISTPRPTSCSRSRRAGRIRCRPARPCTPRSPSRRPRRQLGYRVHAFPEAINSVPYDGRPPCHNCGYCAGYGCPVNARGGAAVSFLRRALLAGAKLVTRAMVTKIATAPNGRATHVEYLSGPTLAPARAPADVVILAASAVESARIALLSDSGGAPERARQPQRPRRQDALLPRIDLRERRDAAAACTRIAGAAPRT